MVSRASQPAWTAGARKTSQTPAPSAAYQLNLMSYSPTGSDTVMTLLRGCWASDPRRVLAEPPDRPAGEEDEPRCDVDHPAPLERVAGQRRVGQRRDAVHRRELRDLLQRRPVLERDEEATGEREDGQAGADDLHDVL